MERQGKAEGRRMFLAAFLLTLAVLATVMVVTVLAVQPSMPEPSGENTTRSYRPPAIDTLTLAVIGEINGQAHEFLLIRFNPQHGQIPLTLLPETTMVTLDGQPLSLPQAYTNGGGRAVKSALEETLGVRVDRYAVIGGAAFVRIASKVGAVDFLLPEDYSYTRDGYRVSLPAGQRQLDGQDVIDLFAAPALRADSTKRSKLLGDLCASIINQNLYAAADEKSTGLFSFAVNLIKTDLSSIDYEPRRESLAFLAGLDAQLSGNLPFYGETGAESMLVPTQEYLRLVRQYFEPLDPAEASSAVAD